jgi:SAM-dependent methyltransferase
LAEIRQYPGNFGRLISLPMSCPLCRSGAASTFATWQTFAVSECSACGFRFVDTSSPLYPRDAQYAFDEPEIGPIRPELPHVQRRVRDILAFRKPPAAAIDFGCGRGELSIALSQRGFRCVGVDMKPRLIEHLQRDFPSVEWRCATTEALVESDARFDVLTLYHVLEHISDPRAALAQVKKLAKPGALIVIEVPNVGGLEARWKGPRWHYYKVDHVCYFRAHDLQRLAGDLDLRILGVRGYQHFSFPQDVAWKDLIKGAMARVGFQDVISVFLEA